LKTRKYHHRIFTFYEVGVIALFHHKLPISATEHPCNSSTFPAMLGETSNPAMNPSKRLKDEPEALAEPLTGSSSVDDSAENAPIDESEKPVVITEDMQQEEQRMHQESEQDYQRRLKQMVTTCEEQLLLSVLKLTRHQYDLISELSNLTKKSEKSEPNVSSFLSIEPQFIRLGWQRSWKLVKRSRPSRVSKTKNRVCKRPTKTPRVYKKLR
jgi:hypothetical protein